jgi:hypothetical protein
MIATEERERILQPQILQATEKLQSCVEPRSEWRNLVTAVYAQ